MRSGQKMKKIITAFLFVLIISISVAFCATTVDTPISFYLLGSVRANASLSISMFEEVFPFDLDGAEVSYNTSTEVVYGLRIGEYTMVSNASTTTLYITHTPLVLENTDGSDANGKHRKIDYRLYAMVNVGDVVFKSCVSDTNANLPTVATNCINISGALRLVNKSLYISLDAGSEGATTAAIGNLTEGIYKSNIYFLLEGE